MTKFRKLNRPTGHRMSMLRFAYFCLCFRVLILIICSSVLRKFWFVVIRTMVSQLVKHERIETTITKVIHHSFYGFLLMNLFGFLGFWWLEFEFGSAKTSVSIYMFLYLFCFWVSDLYVKVDFNSMIHKSEYFFAVKCFLSLPESPFSHMQIF